ncbi:outer membrane beta-barrel family protein [Psychroserpens ponticola]|uniref:Outer membrane beta-barrel family protein n=1 Tax=Psychroserpens ponticola TaxID=2932268 RepID=A0ABY7RV03_9FLAO|nr:outer membrane beta-barrel family protein [Psychroserpens ponticola]WCO00955.1 outer membrane beta-barrel family protein [Psychroserpens ponticola]
MKKITLLCMLLLSTLAYANPTENIKAREGTISGRVIDASLNEPLPYVNVIITDSENNTITGGITQDDGTFEIEKIPEGTVTLSVQYIGFKTTTKTLLIGKGNYNIKVGDVFLEEDVASLDEVTVIAEVSTIQQKVDRKVITIGKDLAASGTASEIMVGIPSVSIDAQTGDISLRGNQNVRVMVDGKLSNIPTAQLLKQIPSTAIKSIELITNPSAKYNPEGMSGIINIVLHKNTMIGFNGNINVGLSKEREAKFNSALNLNYRNGKFNFFGNYSNNFSKNRNRGNVERPENNSEQIFSFLDKRKNHQYKLGVDFYLNDKNTISVFTNQNITDNKTKGRTTAFFYNDMSFNQDQIFTNVGDNTSAQYNFDYKLDFAKEGSNIELEVDHNIYDGENPVNFNQLAGPLSDYKDFNNTDRVRTTINLDYVNPLSESTKLEVGVQARLFNSEILYSSTGDSFNDMGNLAPTPSTDFDYTRDIYSAYGTYSKKFEKWTYQVGLRVENVNIDAVALQKDVLTNAITEIKFDNEYVEVYPSAFFTYTPSEKNSYQLSYSRRVDRPGIGQVNPIKEFSTPLISAFGNQQLEPQFTNSLEVNYTRTLNNRKGSITAGVFYRAISDEINRALFIDRSDVNSGRVILTHDNFDDTSAYGIEVSTNYRPTKWWSINGSFDFYSQTQKGIAENFRDGVSIETATTNDIETNITEVDNIAWNFRMFNNFKVNQKLAFTAFGFYRGENKTLQFNVKPMYFVNLGMRYSFLEDNRATFSFSYNDVFDTMKFGFEGERPFPQIGEFNWESNTWNISLNYRFGGGKYRAKSRKNRDNNEKSGSGGFL